ECSRNCRTTGRVVSSPFCARSMRLRISFASVGILLLLAVVVATFAPPLSSVMLVIPRHDQRCPGKQVSPLMDGVYLAVERFHVLALSLLRTATRFLEQSF